MTNRRLKRGLERLLASRTVGRVTRRRTRGRRLVLAYHGVAPDDASAAGERSLHISHRRFVDHLDMLRETADVCPLADLDTNGDGRPRLAITFDDAYAGAIDLAIPELVARGLPVTIFVAPGCLDGHQFWWDQFAQYDGKLDPGLRQFALEALGGSGKAVDRWARRNGVAPRGGRAEHAVAARLDRLLWAASQPGISVGSHSWSHTNLTRITEARLERELASSLAWLSEKLPARFVPWIAYPYGLHSPSVRRSALAAGYVGGLAIEGGWHRSRDFTPLARPRLNVPAGMSADGLQLRVLGAVLS